jgi:ABC-type nitrate/sulfonate/bicarbonate transport system substrate-binding protein
MRRILTTIMAAAIGGFSLFAATAPLKAAPVEIHLAYGGIPGVISPLLFLKPEILKHYGKTYTVKSTFIRATSIAMQGLASGDFDLSYISFTALANAIKNGGLDIKVIADITKWGSHGHQGPVALVMKDSGINSVNDLKGKILAVTAKGTGFHYALLANLRKAGLKSGDTTIVEVRRPAMGPALKEGRVNLVFIGPPTLYAIEGKDDTKRVFSAEDGMGDVQALVLVGRTKFLKENADVMKDFMEDYITGLRWFLDPKNREEAIKITADFAKRPAPFFASFAFGKKDFYHNPTATPDITALQKNVDLMHDLGVLDQKIEVKPYFDLSYLNAAKDRLGLK